MRFDLGSVGTKSEELILNSLCSKGRTNDKEDEDDNDDEDVSSTFIQYVVFLCDTIYTFL